MSEKIEAFWENATADDVARVMAGETVEARFWDDEHRGKAVGLLVGWVRGEPCWCCEHCKQTGGRSYFEQCQVYREPSWWTNKPDPGPGYRLLGKFPDEELKPGDEYFDRTTIKWRCSTNAKAGVPQPEEIWYRRRLEPVEPEPKHYVLRVGDTVETPSGHRVQVISRSETQRIYSLDAGDKLTLPNGQTITITAKGFEVEQ
jgi:hypothetical protein